eukprot:TRINITY_DN752_c1_g1_i1.p1 TRINITY_DN752_c1_g1~~TRINITY_DN752_c1_g1_i1.p1  ORF type:complete len:322 (+),score=58.16 TRINITY_DN752_c1_g1_i1:106-966(+)
MANAGMFKQAEVYHKEAIKAISDIDPLNQAVFAALEFWTNTLHQQGKTQEAIVRLEEYKRKVINLPGEGPAMVKKILHRAAVLWFTVDKFSETAQYLNELDRYSEEKNLPVSTQILCDLATVQWELDYVNEARETQARMKGCPLPVTRVPPCSRSKYLCTLDCLLVDEVYTLSMRVNRQQPKRKEAEVVEDAEKIRRKLEKCFLEITFEPLSKDGEPVTMSQLVDKPHQFLIRSPKMKGQPDPGRFYEVVIDIYPDSTKEMKVGVHHQLVYALPMPTYVGKPTNPF